MSAKQQRPAKELARHCQEELPQDQMAAGFALVKPGSPAFDRLIVVARHDEVKALSSG